MAKTDIEKQIEVTDGTMTEAEAAQTEYVPVYKVYANTRIAVSKSMGTLWSNRKKEAAARLKNTGVIDRWEESIEYYQSDQGGRTRKKRKLSGVGTGSDKEQKFATENIVFANISALIPATYAKNPDVTITAVDADKEKQCRMYERLVDELLARKAAPTLALKNKMRRSVVMAMLTNVSYLELSYVKKEEGSEEAVSQLGDISKKLAEAKDITVIQELEGQLSALDSKVSLLSPSGPKLNTRDPRLVIVDPDCEESDLSDARWVMIGSFMNTDLLRAVYGERDPETGEWKSIYAPTHVFSAKGKTDSQGHDEEINNFSLLDNTSEHSRYGYESEDDFKQNCRTKVWCVWDKVTRRVYMFNDKDWSWPIWVWDDPYNLTRFFPIFELQFYTDPLDRFGKSEVMYYLDQQDEINSINHERARMRHWATSKIFYDKDATQDVKEIEALLSDSTERNIFGISLGDKKISDIVGLFPLPSTQMEALFDNKPHMESINRLSSVTPVLQNVQFKTNTTNKAIESYESSTQMRLDEKIDAIEDLLADIGQATLEMAVQFMDSETVTQILGETFMAENGPFENMSVADFNNTYSFKIAGGSTLKPTAKVKKEQATQLGQVLGQFANASPMVVVIMLKMIQRAFSDDMVVTDKDWKMLGDSLMQQLQQPPAPPAGQGDGAQQPPQGGQQQPAPTGSDPINEVMAQVEQVIDQLPPEARAALAQGIQQGIPLKQLVTELMQTAQPANQQPA